MKDKDNDKVAGFDIDRELTFMTLTNNIPMVSVDKNSVNTGLEMCG